METLADVYNQVQTGVGIDVDVSAEILHNSHRNHEPSIRGRDRGHGSKRTKTHPVIRTDNHVPLGTKLRQGHSGRTRTDIDSCHIGDDVDNECIDPMDTEHDLYRSAKRAKIGNSTDHPHQPQWEIPSEFAMPADASTAAQGISGLGFTTKIPVDAATGNICVTEAAPMVEDRYVNDMDLCNGAGRKFHESSLRYEEAIKRQYARREYERKLAELASASGGGQNTTHGKLSPSERYRKLVKSIVASDSDSRAGKCKNKNRDGDDDAMDGSESDSSAPTSPARSQASSSSMGVAGVADSDHEASTYRAEIETRYGFNIKNAELAADDMNIVSFIPSKCHGCYAHASASKTVLTEINNMIMRMYMDCNIDTMCEIVARVYADMMRHSPDPSVAYMTPEKWKEHILVHMQLPEAVIAVEASKQQDVLDKLRSTLFIESHDGSAPKPNSRAIKDYKDMAQTFLATTRTLAVFKKAAEKKYTRNEMNQSLVFMSKFTPQTDPVSKLHLIADGLKERGNDFNSYPRRK